MALQTIQGGLFLPDMPRNVSGAPTFTTTTYLIDAADEYVALLFRVPKSGNVSKVLWASRTVTSTAAPTAISIRGETWSEAATPATPSGTLYHANFTGTQNVNDADDSTVFLTSLTAAVAVTKGDKLAIKISNPTTNFAVMQVAGFLDDGADFPFSLLNGAQASGQLILGLEYDDGSYAWIPSVWPFHALTTTTFNNGSPTDEIGLRFKIPFPARLAGFWLWADLDGDWNFNLYDTDGATKLASTPFAVDKDARGSTSAALHLHYLNSTANLTKDVFYRAVIEPSSATSLSIYDFTVNTAAVMDAVAGGQNFHLTSAKNPTQESDWTNTTTRRPFMGIMLDAFDDGTGLVIPTRRGGSLMRM